MQLHINVDASFGVGLEGAWTWVRFGGEEILGIWGLVPANHSCGLYDIGTTMGQILGEKIIGKKIGVKKNCKKCCRQDILGAPQNWGEILRLIDLENPWDEITRRLASWGENLTSWSETVFNLSTYTEYFDLHFAFNSSIKINSHMKIHIYILDICNA